MFEVIFSPTFKKEVRKYPQFKNRIKKQLDFLQEDIKHPSLNVEKLQPKHAGLYSLRVNQQMRILFTMENKIIELLSFSKHYE